MLRFVLTIGLLSSTPVYAQTADQEARFYEATKAMEAQTYAFYTSIDDRFARLLAPTSEDPDFRDNQRCMMARIEHDGGPDVLEEYIAAMEVLGGTEITSLVELGSRLPKVMTSDLIFAASAECGPMSHSLKQMTTPEFLELMDDPEIMQRLMGN